MNTVYMPVEYFRSMVKYYCRECYWRHEDGAPCVKCVYNELYNMVNETSQSGFQITARKSTGRKKETMNTVNLIGRMTKNPSVKEIDKGKDGKLLQAVFTLAVDRNGDEADFIRCVAYGKTAEVIDDYCGKGVRVGITGHIRTGSYENKDGDTVYTQDIIVDRFDFADARKAADPEPEPEKERGRSRARR